MYTYCSNCGIANTTAEFDKTKFPVATTANTAAAATAAVFRVLEVAGQTGVNVEKTNTMSGANTTPLFFDEHTKLEIDGEDLVYLKCIETTGDSKVTYYDLVLFNAARTIPTANNITKNSYIDYLARFKILAYIKKQNYEQDAFDIDNFITDHKLNINHYINSLTKTGVAVKSGTDAIRDILDIVKEINSKYHDKYELLINCLYHYYQLIIYEYNYNYVNKQLNYYKDFTSVTSGLIGTAANSVHDILEKILKDLLVTLYTDGNKSAIDKALVSGTSTNTFISDLANLCGTTSTSDKNMNVVFYDPSSGMYNSSIDSDISSSNTITYLKDILTAYGSTTNMFEDYELNVTTKSNADKIINLLKKFDNAINATATDAADSVITVNANNLAKIKTVLGLIGVPSASFSSITETSTCSEYNAAIKSAIHSGQNTPTIATINDITSAVTATTLSLEIAKNQIKFILLTPNTATYKYAAVAVNAFLDSTNDTAAKMKAAIRKEIIDFGSTFDGKNNIIIDESLYSTIGISDDSLSSNDESIFLINIIIATSKKLNTNTIANIKSIKCNGVLAKLTSASHVENALDTLTFSDNFKTTFVLSTKYPSSIPPPTADITAAFDTDVTGVLAKLQAVKTRYDNAKELYNVKDKLLKNYTHIETAIDSQIDSDTKNESSIETKIKTIKKYNESYEKSVDKYKTNHTELNKVVKSNLYNNIFLYVTIFVIILACLGLIYINNNKENLRTQYSIVVIVFLLLYYIIYTNLVINVTEEFFAASAASATSPPKTAITNTELGPLHNKIYNRLLILSGAEYNYNKSLDKEKAKYKEYAKSTDTKVQSLKMVLNDEFINAVKSKELIKFLLLFTFISIVTYIAHINIDDLTTTCILFIILFIIVLCIYFYNINLVSRSIYTNKYWNHQMIKK